MSNQNFTFHAHNKMLELFESHEHEVGRERYKEDPEQYLDLERTDCITYVMNCMSYGFKMSNHPDAAEKVWEYIIKGVDLARYLMHKHDWECVYLNPDVRHPFDEDPEHSFSYRIVKKRCEYYGLPVFATAIDYRPTKETESGKKYSKSKRTKLNPDDIKKLEEVKFGFGLSRGGTHTWLFSEGKVYEVHWWGLGRDGDLYERSDIEDFPWLSSVVVVPPEAAKLLRQNGINKCNR